MNRRILLLFIFLISGRLHSTDSAPSWLNNIPSDDLKYRYFQGIGNSSNEQEAYEYAKKDAEQSAIKEVFGVKTRIDTRTYENNKSAKIIHRTAEASEEIFIKDFSQSGFFKEKTNNSFTVYVLYKYPKEEIQKEKVRLSELKQDVIVSLIAIRSEDIGQNQTEYTPESSTKVSSIYKWLQQFSSNLEKSDKAQISFWDGSLPNGKVPITGILFAGASGKTTNASNINTWIGGLQFERLFPPIGIRAGFGLIGGSNDTQKQEGYSLLLSTPIYFVSGKISSTRFFIEPQYGYYQSTLQLTPSKKIDLNQNGFSLIIGGTFSFLEFKAGVTQFSGSSGYSGITSLFISGGLLLPF